MPIFSAVGVATYIVQGVILHRLLVSPPSPQRTAAIRSLLVLMAANEAWSLAFFGSRRTSVGFAGMLAFLVPLATAERALFKHDAQLAKLLLPYCAWVVLYDIPWSYGLWRKNRPA